MTADWWLNSTAIPRMCCATESTMKVPGLWQCACNMAAFLFDMISSRPLQTHCHLSFSSPRMFSLAFSEPIELSPLGFFPSNSRSAGAWSQGQVLQQRRYASEWLIPPLGSAESFSGLVVGLVCPAGQVNWTNRLLDHPVFQTLKCSDPKQETYR